jgi:hypothetical protein
MQKALIFILALAFILFIVFSKPKEGFTDLMGVNWTEMNKGTPKALYTNLPIKQPKVVNLAEAGVGNIQPSPPSPGTLPSAPAPQRSLETPSPYIDPTNEPAKYIRILGVKEDLQAFFGFQAFMLQERNDPAIQIPLCRARADMAELINVQSVMERNPGLPSRINNKQLNDIQANLNYLRDILHELESSGAIQPQAPIEGFTSMYDTNNPIKVYIKEYLIPMFNLFSSKTRGLGHRDRDGQNIADDVKEKAQDLDIYVNDRINSNPNNPEAIRKINEMGADFLNGLIRQFNIMPNVFNPITPYDQTMGINGVDMLVRSVPTMSSRESGNMIQAQKYNPSEFNVPSSATKTFNSLMPSPASSASQIISGVSSNNQLTSYLLYQKDYFIPVLEKLTLKLDKFNASEDIKFNTTMMYRSLADVMQNKSIEELLNIIKDRGDDWNIAYERLNEQGKIINLYIEQLKIPSSEFAPLVPYEKNFTVEDVRRLIERDPRSRGRQSDSSLGSTTSGMSETRSMGSIPPTMNPSTNLSTQYTTVTTDKRASLKQLQDFQIRVVVEIKRLQASGTSDPVINGRLNTLMRIQDDVDQVISQIQNGSLTPETVPIYASDIERALPLLGKPSDPLPTILKENNLPPAIANLFPGGLSPKDTEQAQQINNVVAGYMDNIFEGTSWGLSLNLKYDNPNVAKLATRKAEAEAITSVFGKKNTKKKNVQEVKGEDKALSYLIKSVTSDNIQGTGVPGLPEIKDKEKFTGYDSMMASEAPVGPNFSLGGFEMGLPGTSIDRTLPEPRIGRLDWRQRSQQIKEQIRRRGMDPKHFGALPDDANVSSDFSWRGYAQMMCMRLNTTMDPGLAETCGCPPQGWQGWRD